MSEEKYRVCQIVLMAVFVLGFLVLGYRLSENGRYVQYDPSKNMSADGKTKVTPTFHLLDTKTGQFVNK
jgi:hypothetical protein